MRPPRIDGDADARAVDSAITVPQKIWPASLIAIALILLLVLAVLGDAGRSVHMVGRRNLRPASPKPLVVEKVVYVPVYPRLYGSATGTDSVPMLVTLSLRNVSHRVPVIVSRVETYDSDGRSIRTFIDEPNILGPMQTADFAVPAGMGGSGANFVVTWGLEAPGPDLLVEAVMQAEDGESGVSFTTRGHVVEERALRPERHANAGPRREALH